MNIWSMSKHKSIKLLLFKLLSQLGKEDFCIEDEDNKDYFSFSLIKPEQPEIRAYVYTYGQMKDMYGIHLEYPWFIEYEFNDSVQVYEDLSAAQIINTLVTHFDVSSLEMAV